MAASDAWTTIESDPGVFTELIEAMGVKSVQVEELYVLEPSSLQSLKPVFGLIFLFKWQPGDKEDKKVVVHDPSIYFANQVITNACATQAMLSILLNMGDKVDIGQELTNLKTFTADFPPELKGITISNADAIRLAHNSFAPPEACIAENELKKATSDNDVYHFVSYIHSGGAVWELDGLQEGPIKHVECTEEEWLDKVCPIITERIATYSQREIRFNLMAVVKNRKEVLQEQLDELLQSMDSDDGSKDARVQQLRMDIEAEEHKRHNWAQENIRRKHNYIPFIFNFLKVLAQNDKLDGLIETAKQKMQAQSSKS